MRHSRSCPGSGMSGVDARTIAAVRGGRRDGCRRGMAGRAPPRRCGRIRRLRFRGVTITDGINAGAVTRFGDLAKRSVLAARAGADLILCAATDPNHNAPALGIRVRRAIALAMADHQISRASAEAAADRILALRRRP